MKQFFCCELWIYIKFDHSIIFHFWFNSKICVLCTMCAKNTEGGPMTNKKTWIFSGHNWTNDLKEKQNTHKPLLIIISKAKYSRKYKRHKKTNKIIILITHTKLMTFEIVWQIFSLQSFFLSFEKYSSRMIREIYIRYLWSFIGRIS